MALKQAHVHMADEEVVLRNVKAISEAGPSKLLVSGLPALGCLASWYTQYSRAHATHYATNI